MYVKHLQEYLEKFTNGRKGNAISNAKTRILNLENRKSKSLPK